MDPRASAQSTSAGGHAYAWFLYSTAAVRSGTYAQEPCRPASASAGLRRRRRSISPSTPWPPPRAGLRTSAGCRERIATPYRKPTISARADGNGLTFGDDRMLARKQALSVTDAAAQRIQAL